MFTSKKLISLLVITAFVLQGCARGVTPTKGLENSDGKETHDELSKTISAQLCLDASDQDSDGDGICDKDDKGLNGEDCSQDAFCINGDNGPGDEYVNPSKSKWWLYVGIVGVAAVGTLVAKQISGNWWWDGLKAKETTLDNDLFVIATKIDNTIALKYEEDFKPESDGTHSKLWMELGARHGYNFTRYGGKKIGKGDKVIICINSIFGHAPSNVVSGTSGVATTATLRLGNTYQKIAKLELPNEDTFRNFCNQRQGAFEGLVNDDKSVWVNAIPAKLLNSLQAENAADPTIDVRYVFTNLHSQITVTTPITYHRENATNFNLATADHETLISDNAKKDAYNACGTDVTNNAQNNCKLAILFGNHSGLPETKAKLAEFEKLGRQFEGASILVEQNRDGTYFP